MKTPLQPVCPFFLAVLLAMTSGSRVSAQSGIGGDQTAPIPFDQLGVTAEQKYQGDGLAVIATEHGARLRCVFQKLKGEVTREGLWLTSTAGIGAQSRFRVVAQSIGRTIPVGTEAGQMTQLETSGEVDVKGKLARYLRSMVMEEYSVSVDGLRQDFVIAEQPEGEGALRLELGVYGASAEYRDDGAVVLRAQGSGRCIAYGQLKVFDALGTSLRASLELGSVDSLAVIVDDSDAVFPLTVDPTFSDADWISQGGFPGANGPVHALAVDAAGNLYIGGDFSAVGNVFARNIARWNGDEWFAFEYGLDDRVNALVVDGPDTAGNFEVFAGGDFTRANGTLVVDHLASWRGNASSGAWGRVASVNGPVYALAKSGFGLYVGGSFTVGLTITNIMKWEYGVPVLGSLNGGVNGTVRTLAVSGGVVYAGGDFTMAGGVLANRVASWNGSTWSPLAAGMNNSVFALATSGSLLYATGDFTMAGSSAASRVARWNGSAWSALGAGLNERGSCVATSGAEAYFGGYFTSAGGQPANRIARWSGSAWSVVRTGANSPVYTLARSADTLFAGGTFNEAGGIPAAHIARWSDNSWLALGTGFNNTIYSLAASGSRFLAGGAFTSTPGGAANRIAEWNGSNWSSLGSGLDDRVTSVAVESGDVYVGGFFSKAGGLPANKVAKWNGQSWSSLGSGLDSYVMTITATNGQLYAGGIFSTAGGIPAARIAKWNGGSWSALGSGLNGTVNTILPVGQNVYVGGDFSMAGGAPASKIAKWDGNAWSPLGSGVNYEVSALARAGANIFAAGSFTAAGGAPASHIAMWNGNAWAPVGTGANGLVTALLSMDNEVIIGGEFSQVGSLFTSCFAKWDGGAWQRAGSGVNAIVWSLAAVGSDVYAGGNFVSAAGRLSPYLVKLDLTVIPSIAYSKTAAEIQLSWPSSGTSGFLLQQTSNVSDSATWSPSGEVINDNGTTKSTTLPIGVEPEFFRLRKEP